MRPVSPGTGAPEVVIAENQLEYSPLPIACYQEPANGARLIVTRWKPSADERAAIAKGEDLYLTTWLSPTGGVPPVDLSAGPLEWMIITEADTIVQAEIPGIEAERNGTA